MEFGMPTLIEIDSLEETVKLCDKLSLSFVELNMNLPAYQTARIKEEVEYIKALSKKYNVYFTVHLDENLNVWDFNDDVKNAYLFTVQKAIELAKLINAPILNMHMNHGVYFTLPNKRVNLFEQYKDLYLQFTAEFITLCENSVGTSDIKICIENSNGFREYEKEAIGLMLKSKAFGLTWDIGHSNAVNNIDEKFIMENADKLSHFHIHDGLENIDHMALGTGKIDLMQRLHISQKHNCRCVIETKTVDALRGSAVWLSENNYLQ